MPNVTLEKGLLVLETMAADAKEFSLGEISELTGLSRSHACKLLASLVSRGYVVRNGATRGYQIGLRTLELSSSILERMELRRRGLAYLHDLSDRTGSASYLGVNHMGKVLVLETVYPAGVYNAATPGFGSTMPLHDSAMGWAMLAAMPPEERVKNIPTDQNLDREIARTQCDGVAVIERPREPHATVVGVAAVVRDYRGQVIGALGASTGKEDWDHRDQVGYKTHVINAAAGLSFALGHAASRSVVKGLSR